MSLCDVHKPKYNSTDPCTRSPQYSVLMTNGDVELLCAVHLAMFHTFGHSVVSWCRIGTNEVRWAKK